MVAKTLLLGRFSLCLGRFSLCPRLVGALTDEPPEGICSRTPQGCSEEAPQELALPQIGWGGREAMCVCVMSPPTVGLSILG